MVGAKKFETVSSSIQKQPNISYYTFKMAEKTEKVKKRKRVTDGSSKPSKKMAIERSTQIKFSHQEVDAWAPIIGKPNQEMSSASSRY